MSKEQAADLEDKENSPDERAQIVSQPMREEAWINPLYHMLITINKDGIPTATLPFYAHYHPELTSNLLRSAAALASASTTLAKDMWVNDGTVVPNVAFTVPDPTVHTGMAVAVNPVDMLNHALQDYFNVVISGHRAAIQSPQVLAQELTALLKTACAPSLSH